MRRLNTSAILPSLVGMLVLVLFGFGCASEEDEGSGNGNKNNQQEEPPVVLTTEQQRLCPTKPADNPDDAFCDEHELLCKNPALYSPDADIIAAAYEFGFGKYEPCDGEPAEVRTDLGVEQPEGVEPVLLLRFFHISDVHITDEESPIRAADLDTRLIDAALRPQDMYTTQVLDAVVRTINAFHYYNPTDFVLFTGDLTDTAQENEVDWLLAVLTGGEVNPDSGDDDDPIPGEGNDPQDPFKAEGLKLPFYLALGNHDELVLGNTPITTDNQNGPAEDTTAMFGTRDGTTFSIIKEGITPDPKRKMLLHKEFLQKIYDAAGEPKGHGLSQENVENDKGYYYFDVDARDGDIGFRFIVLDTANRPGGCEGNTLYTDGVLDKDQVENFLIPALQEAMEQKRLVFVAGHHQFGQIHDDGFPDRYYDGEELKEILHQYPNVVAYLMGHGHQNRVYAHPHPSHDPAHPENGYWEIEAPSLIDFPMQIRLMEVYRWGNGVYSLKTVVVDFVAEEGSLAQKARELTLIDVQTGWCPEGREGRDKEDRNGELLFKAPEGW